MSETASLIISIIALLGSLFATIFQVSQDRSNLRGQLTDICNKINESLSTMTKMQDTMIDPSKNAAPGSNMLDLSSVAQGGYLTEQMYGYSMQARFIATKIPQLVTDYDNVVIARGFRNALEIDIAKQYYQLAFTKAATPLFKIYISREIGNFLVTSGEKEAGQAMFRYALQVPNANPVIKQNLDLQTFYSWAGALGFIFEYDQALAVVDDALHYCLTIQDPIRQSSWKSYLERYKNSIIHYRTIAVNSGIQLPRQ